MKTQMTGKQEHKFMISMIIPVYNAQESLPKLLGQIKKEQNRQLEVILVNDGSRDNSLQIINRFISGIANMKVIDQDNRGAPYARNIGMKHAEGKYLWFFDADDILEDGVVTELLGRLEYSEADILIGNMKFVDEKGRGRVRVPVFEDEEATDTHKLFFWDSFPGNKIYKRDLICKNKIYWSNVKIQQDLNFYLKVIPFCSKVQYTGTVLYDHVEHKANSISATFNRKVTDAVRAVGLVSNFYLKKGILQNYEKELEYNLVKHVLIQIEKLPKMKWKDRVYVYLYFRGVLKRTSYEQNPYISGLEKEKIHRYMRFVY